MAYLVQVMENVKEGSYRVGYSLDCHAGYKDIGPCDINHFAKDLLRICRGVKRVDIETVNSECYSRLPKEKMKTLETLLKGEETKFKFI